MFNDNLKQMNSEMSLLEKQRHLKWVFDENIEQMNNKLQNESWDNKKHDEKQDEETENLCLSFRRKFLASWADDQADETETEVKIEETGEREAIWT